MLKVHLVTCINQEYLIQKAYRALTLALYKKFYIDRLRIKTVFTYHGTISKKAVFHITTLNCQLNTAYE